jgi:hypothetical protein
MVETPRLVHEGVFIAYELRLVYFESFAGVVFSIEYIQINWPIDI